MSIHLHELVEAITSNRVVTSLSESCKKVSGAIAHTVNVSTKCLCFQMGDADEIIDYAKIPSLIRLPYESVWMECTLVGSDQNAVVGSDQNAVVGFALEEGLSALSDAKRIAGFAYRRIGGEWWLDCPIQIESDGTKIHVAKGATRHIDGGELLQEFYSNIISAFLSALNCCNVQRIESIPDEKLQKARARRGKPPLFSYWTLALDLVDSAASKGSMGSTHASPRLHLRRGHARLLPDGRGTWVRACVVGNKQLGMIHKDYAVRAAA